MSKFNKKPLKKSYFREAMNHFREECDTEKIAFLFVSDDMEWGRKNLKNKHKDLFFVGKEDHVGHDFAVLVHSNHSVTSLGSFSTWVSILNTGDTYGRYGPISRSITDNLSL